MIEWKYETRLLIMDKHLIGDGHRRNMYAYGAHWTGADISENQITYAKQLSQEAGMDISYLVSAAEDIDFPDESFDVITACQ